MSTKKNPLKEVIKNEDVKFLCKYLFKVTLTRKQEEIVRIIAYSKHRRVAVNCMTRYGKSYCVALGVALFILFNSDKKVAIIAPTLDQTTILRNYFGELIVQCPLLADIVDIERDNSIMRLKREASRKRLTFKNGIEVRILSAHGEAQGLMGFGADVVIKDESCLINNIANTKIMRMLGDNAEKAILIELANPWDKDNKYYEHWNSDRYHKIHVGWRDAISEGRVTKDFIDEMREELTPLEFSVLYESKFPDEGEDSLFSFAKINKMFENELNIKGQKIISCDVADKGLDRTVIMRGYKQDNKYKVVEVYSEAKSDNMTIANKIIDWHKEFKADVINIDTIGVGTGVVSRVKEVLGGSGVKINACHFGEKPEEDYHPTSDKALESKSRFSNKKAQQYFKLRDLIHDECIDVPFEIKLKTELMNMKWELNPSGKIKILDPEDKSPDFADSLVYFIWGGELETGFFFG